mmetsp:Transcript_30958/g.51289  ORF Transcript_30958/g.51289 Transcript_30958/m.51289 type:complete len:439 (+) Transcript_30958:304-1620(+)
MKHSTSLFSACAGMIDLVYNSFRKRVQPPAERWFRRGFGDLPRYFSACDEALDAWEADGLKDYLQVPVSIRWREWPADAQAPPDVLLDEGSFESPLATFLPPESRMVRFLFVRAVPGGKHMRTRGIYVHTAATGTCTYTERERGLAYPLLEHGIASILLIPPYNGKRSPTGQEKHYIDNVADYMLQSLAIVLEATALLRTLACSSVRVRPSELYEAGMLPLGVTGLSWGGAMAACAALISRLPVACMVGLGSDSPRVMATGAIRWQLDFNALMKGSTHSRAEAEQAIIAVFTRITFAKLLARGHGATLGSCVQVAAADDHYVSPQECQQLHASLAKATPPGRMCELRWVDGGHALTFIRLTATFLEPCIVAMDWATPLWTEHFGSRHGEVPRPSRSAQPTTSRARLPNGTMFAMIALAALGVRLALWRQDSSRDLKMQ